MANKFPNSGILSKNLSARPGTKDSNLSGSANIDGIEYWIAGWTKDRKDGGKFISLAFKKKDMPRQDAMPIDEDIRF